MAIKKFLLALVFAGTAAAQTASLSVINALVPIIQCKAGAQTLVAWTGASVQCITLPSGWSITGGILTVPAPANSGTPIYGETPGGAINGTNAAFTLANVPVTGSVRVYLNGLRMCAGTCSGITPDYSISGSTITFNSASIPVAGDILLADYSH